MPQSARARRMRSIFAVALASLALLGATPVLLRHHARTRAHGRAPVTRHEQAAAVGGARVARQPLTQATAPRPATQMIVAVGDSITKGDWDTNVGGGWVTRLRAKLRLTYPRTLFVVRNAGIDGDTTAGVLARLGHDVLATHPALVIVSIGTNDFDYGVSMAAYAAELRLLVGRLRAASSSPVVVLVSMLPIAGQSPARLLAQRAYNDIIRRTAAAMRVGYLDLFDPWLALGPTYLHALRHDTEHPNSIGYELLASTTAAFLEAGYLDPRGRIAAPSVPPTCSAIVCGA